MRSISVEVKIINKSDNPLPKYQTDGSVGCDLYANETISIEANCHALISTGVFVELPKGWEIQIRSRSGLAFKHGVFVLNSPGTIDSDYRGEIKVLLFNSSKTLIQINEGDRIAQAVLSPVYHIQWLEADQLNSTQRNSGGFGHTGQ